MWPFNDEKLKEDLDDVLDSGLTVIPFNSEEIGQDESSYPDDFLILPNSSFSEE